MIQLGAVLSGFSLFALFTWLPIWQMAASSSAEHVFKHFVVVMMLVFGVFMTSAGNTGFSFLRFTPAFVAGILISMGYSGGQWWLAGAGLVIFAAGWLFLGD